MTHRPRTISLVALSALLGACGGSDEPPAPVLEGGLDARALFVRASLDVRGVRPSAGEFARLEDPAELSALLDELVEDARLGDQIGTVFADALRTRRDFWEFGPEDYGLDEERYSEMASALSEEITHIVGHATVSGAPFSTIVTGDTTVVDPILLEIWPLEVTADQPSDLPEGTTLARYTDGRPTAGILATNSFYWRHTSTEENANRGRTNAISRALLCEDYLDRPIEFPKDVDLTDTASIHNAIATNQACQACHSTLDPVASHMWGFIADGDDALSFTYYLEENEDYWEDATGAKPAYFGVPTSGKLDGLAQAIAADGRFEACTVRRVYEAFLGRPAELDDEGQLAVHRAAFAGAGQSMKALVRSLLDDPAYRGITAESTHGGEPAAVLEKLVTPEQLASSLYELSGFVATYDGRVITRVDYGVRALAGGSEHGAATSPSPGHVLVHRRLAEAAARAIVDGETLGGRVGALLEEVDLSEPPDAALLVALVREIRSRELDGDSGEIAALRTLWNETASGSDPADAWTALLTALFADPDLAID